MPSRCLFGCLLVAAITVAGCDAGDDAQPGGDDGGLSSHAGSTAPQIDGGAGEDASPDGGGSGGDGGSTGENDASIGEELGGSGGDGGSDGGSTVTSVLVLGADPNAPVNDAIRAVCKRIVDCSEGGFGPLTTAECELYLAQPCLGWGLVIEEDGLADCATAIAGWECDDDDDNQVEEYCADGAVARAVARVAGIPIRTEGESCGDLDLCAYGNECSGPGQDECSTCVAVPVPGDACLQGGLCSDNQFCDADGRCQPQGGLRDDCSEDAHCRSGHCVDGKCSFMIPNGEPCIRGEYCASGYCENDLCADNPDGEDEPGEAGDACTEHYDCASERCVEGMCQARVPLGGECASTFECGVNAQCVDGTCVLVASCTAGSEGDPCPIVGCAAGLACDDATGRCRAGDDDPLAVGASCLDDFECASGYCAGTCQLRSAMMPCGSGDQCLSAMCEQGFCKFEGASMCQ